MSVLILICLVAVVLFILKSGSTATKKEADKADKDFEDNFLNGATGDDIDDFGK
jgi:cbb3-type cytochrome oxidase subunit 3